MGKLCPDVKLVNKNDGFSEAQERFHYDFQHKSTLFYEVAPLILVYKLFRQGAPTIHP